MKQKKNIKQKSKVTQQLDSLAKISSAIASNQYLKEILHLIVTVTAEMMNSKICSIMLLDTNKNELIIEATQSLSERYIKKGNIKIGQSISGRALELARPIKVVDVRSDGNYQFPQIARQEGIVSMLSVPMLVRGKPIGVINSYTEKEHDFTDDEMKVLQAVANQAAIAIDNTKLMQETMAARNALETRKLVERAKGILMKENRVDEDAAYRLIHKKSMDTRKSMKEIAEAILMSHEIRKEL
ncbi:MAG: ANTAR domain-containing protein [Elusimicrobia bacterium]|nr:ANTAR domain-containing protein [Elusimicrobiota bacterium]MBD3412515.1 ANTAR domain-containing protein [Elusimicrobiota bacterium]